jgi:catechol 2,3-dioxygenase-like lactoylglutathione lyase family enzyme
MKCVNLHHVGLWVEDIDKAIAFFTGIMGFRLVTRGPRGSIGPGERAMIHAGGDQFVELLTEPDVEPHPGFPVHPLGHVAGVPHVCLRVTDLPAWRAKLEAEGYTITGQFPREGFDCMELGVARLIFFIGPGGAGFELFEFQEEYTL